ncbi:transglutaminase family protein [Roseomonas sp. OT10]|uniref:transglutaminase-like domain-containing protein n=1 Tax=Roseomonas cutis TaxID=2897332 RepID=UPI001E3D9D17|nr:transglutaminase family protein [Roseomonas sp. OT10]UFN49627.1 transglutaminase family protein [Roseomonas sp. OT10]
MAFVMGCTLTYRVQQPTPFVFNIEAQRFEGQVVEQETLTIEPDLPVERWTMPESGNRYLRVLAQPGELTVRYEAQVSLARTLEEPASIQEVPMAELPLAVLPHTYPSRYCQSDKLDRFARRTFGGLEPGYRRVNGICNWICDNVDYIRGSSDALTSAFDTVTQRAGVCRDFAHLGIALCRALGIPARYVSAYAFRLDPLDFHAVFEAFLQGPEGPGWYLFDPTRMSAPDGLVRIGIGRDAAEVAFASPFGEVEYDPPKVFIRKEGEMEDIITTQAVRSEAA